MKRRKKHHILRLTRDRNSEAGFGTNVNAHKSLVLLTRKIYRLQNLYENISVKQNIQELENNYEEIEIVLNAFYVS